MAKTTKAQKTAEAALDAAATAAKDAKRLSKTLPKKDAKKLRAVAEEAKNFSHASKKKLERNLRKVEKKAKDVIARIEKVADKAEGKRAAAAARTDPVLDGSAASAVVLAEALSATLPTTDLASLTVVQLRDRARAAGHRGFSRLSKAQLIELLSS